MKELRKENLNSGNCTLWQIYIFETEQEKRKLENYYIRRKHITTRNNLTKSFRKETRDLFQTEDL
jgi:hypothetical protein